MYNDIRGCPDTVCAVWAADKLAAGTFAGGFVLQGLDVLRSEHPRDPERKKAHQGFILRVGGFRSDVI